MAKTAAAVEINEHQLAHAKAAACRDLAEHLRCGVVDGAAAVSSWTQVDGASFKVTAKVVFDVE